MSAHIVEIEIEELAELEKLEEITELAEHVEHAELLKLTRFTKLPELSSVNLVIYENRTIYIGKAHMPKPLCVHSKKKLNVEIKIICC